MGTRSAVSEVKLSFSSTIKNTLPDSQVASASLGETLLSGKLQSGVDASEANRAWEDRDRAIASGNTEDIDIYDFASQDIGAGNGRDALGQEIVLEEVVSFAVKQETGPGRLEVMPTNPAAYWTCAPSLTVAKGNALKAGGAFAMHQPDTDAFDVQDGVSHVVRFGANGGAVTYSLYILGRHDDDESSSSSSSSCSTASSSTQSSSSST